MLILASGTVPNVELNFISVIKYINITKQIMPKTLSTNNNNNSFLVKCHLVIL